MLFAALGFWLIVILLCAWGVHHTWSHLLRPRVVNVALLPGTLVAQLGHVVGLLITGGTVTNTALVDDDAAGSPRHSTGKQSRIPLIGPVIVAMLPLVACAAGIVAAARIIGGPLVHNLTTATVADTLPTTLPAFWQLLRDQVTLMETTLAAILQADPARWQNWAFVYLLICLTVRMAPFPGQLRGSFAAIVVICVLSAIANALFGGVAPHVQQGWGILSLAVAILMLLLLFSVLTRGAVGLFRILIRQS